MAGPLVSLDDTLEVADVGGKAWSLSRIARAKLPVPPGYALHRVVFDELLVQDGLGDFVRATLEGLDVHDIARLGAVSDALRTRVLAAELPADLVAKLAALDFGEPPLRVAVRSSALGEDSKEASFAGQLDSILNVEAGPDVARAVLACFASCFNARAIFYQRTRGIALGGMAVVVQRMVPAKLAGVLFTEAPGSRGEMLLEYCYGLGEALVSGDVNPGRLAIDRTSGAVRVEARPDDPDEALDRLMLDGATINDLVAGAQLLERELGGPQDIEWAIDGDGRVYFLQSRPITTAGVVPASRQLRAEAATDAKAPRVRFSNANVNENFPEPITPLLYSVARTGYYHYFRNVGLALGISEARISRVEHPLRHIIGVHGGRMYYNLSSIYEVLRVAPFGEQLAAYFDQFVGVDDGGSADDKAVRREKPGALFELVGIAVQTTRQYADLDARITTFERTVDDFAARSHPRLLGGKTRHELLEDFRGFFRIRCHEWKDASLADTAAMVMYGLLARVLRGAFPDDEAGALHNTLLKGLPDVVSSKPVEVLWALSRLLRDAPDLARRFHAGEASATIAAALEALPASSPVRAAWDGYLETWGFRGSGELMLTVPSFQEDPAALVDVVRLYLTMQGTAPADVILEQATLRERETERVLSELRRRPLIGGVPGPALGIVVDRLLRATHASIRFRERARLKQALLYSRLRRLVLAIGDRLVRDGRLAQPGDVFFLTHPEIDDLLAGSAMFPHGVRDLVALRAREHAALSATTPADTVVLGEGDYLPLVAPPATRTPAAADGKALTGVGTCGGRISAPAAVMRDLGDMGKLVAGDILVTRQTDPGWAPVFFLVKGLVMERGGMLSHGAIIAREFGIPAVVGIRDATTRIGQRQQLTVDGDRGQVEIHD